jgi:hypothetical protein
MFVQGAAMEVGAGLGSDLNALLLRFSAHG